MNCRCSHQVLRLVWEPLLCFRRLEGFEWVGVGVFGFPARGPRGLLAGLEGQWLGELNRYSAEESIYVLDSANMA